MFCMLFVKFQDPAARNTIFRNYVMFVRSCDPSLYTSIKAHTGSFTEFTHVLRTVYPVLRSLGVKAHTSSHLPLATQAESAALTQYNVRRIEAHSSQEDEAYRPRNMCNKIHWPLRELHFP